MAYCLNGTDRLGAFPRASGCPEEVPVDERSQVAVASLVGAGVGALLGYLYLTDSGRRVRDQIEPWFDDLIGEIRRWRNAVEKAREASNEAWRSLDELTGETVPRSARHSMR